MLIDTHRGLLLLALTLFVIRYHRRSIFKPSFSHQWCASSMSHRNRDNQVGKWKMRSRLPTQCYLDIANSGYTILPDADLKLVILDLNGTLVWRPKSATSARIPKLRPGLATFIPYLMSNFAVMIWSSSAPHSVTAMVMLQSRESARELTCSVQRDLYTAAKTTACGCLGARYPRPHITGL